MVNGHSFILIRQMAALVRCALAEVCTVPLLLVFSDFGGIKSFTYLLVYSLDIFLLPPKLTVFLSTGDLFRRCVFHS